MLQIPSPPPGLHAICMMRCSGVGVARDVRLVPAALLLRRGAARRQLLPGFQRQQNGETRPATRTYSKACGCSPAVTRTRTRTQVVPYLLLYVQLLGALLSVALLAAGLATVAALCLELWALTPSAKQKK